MEKEHKRQVEYVTLNIRVQDVPNIVKTLQYGTSFYRRQFYKDKLESLAAYFDGFATLAYELAQQKPDATIKVKLSVEAFKLLLRALRTRLNYCKDFFESQKWGKIYYYVRGQVDRSVWKQSQHL